MDLKYSVSNLNIMLVMNYKCNCACKYCFENINKSLLTENSVDIQKIVKFILDIYTRNKCDMLTLTFFGGEPILSLKEISYVSEALNKANINVKFLVITNGTLLTKLALEKLIKTGIRNYQITIDGPKAIHDARRPCKNKKSCWDMIMKNLNYFSELDLELSLRINIDNQNIEFLDELIFSLPQKIVRSEKTSIYIAPVVGCLDCTSTKTLNYREQTLKTAWKKIKKNNYPILISPPVYAPCPRHSKESAFYLDMQGNIYTCGGFVGNIDRIEKRFEEKFDEYFTRLKYTPPETCFKCTFFPVCMGGCQFEASILGSSCQKSYLKGVYDEYFTAYCRY